MGIDVRLGGSNDVDAAVTVYERSNLARRHGRWPARAARVRHVAQILKAPGSWSVIAYDGAEAVGMALVLPFRADRGQGDLVPGWAYLDLIYVLPERWGEGIGRKLLDIVITEADRRDCPRVVLWTQERDNARAHRLYTSAGFTRTGETAVNDDGEPVAEWAHDIR
jgi:GNAT superfamily N-acetyltransferase